MREKKLYIIQCIIEEYHRVVAGTRDEAKEMINRKLTTPGSRVKMTKITRTVAIENES